MGKLIDLTGKRFGRLKVKRRYKKKYPACWLCKCSCGTRKVITSYSLLHGLTKSCGCLKIEKQTKHGHSRRNNKSDLHAIWGSMIQRCTNKKNKYYKNYGGRGIKVCERWLEFKNFVKDMSPRPKGLTLDRKDNDGNYTPKNCRWATYKQQNNNQRGRL